MTRAVTERDFRMPEFKDAKPEDYEIRDDGAVVRKDRWETGLRSIAHIVGLPMHGDVEIADVVEAVDRLQRAHETAQAERALFQPPQHHTRLEWLTFHSAAIEAMTSYRSGGDVPFWYVTERQPEPGADAPNSAAMGRCRVFGESEVSIEDAIDNAMERLAAGKEPYYV